MGRVVVVHGHRDSKHWPGISYECEKRVRHAQSILEKDDVIILSGSGKDGWDSEAAQMNSFCQWSKDHEIILEEESNTTIENYENVLPLALSLKPKEIVVVSNWWHLRIPIIWLGCPIRFQFSRAPGDYRYLEGELQSWKQMAASNCYTPSTKDFERVSHRPF